MLQRSRFLGLTKRIAASGNENALQSILSGSPVVIVTGPLSLYFRGWFRGCDVFVFNLNTPLVAMYVFFKAICDFTAGSEFSKWSIYRQND